MYSYVNNNPLSYTDPTGHFLHKKIKKAFKRVTKWGERVAHQFKEQVARSTTYALQKVSGVNYVGGLLSTGLVAGTQFGYAYGASTGGWRKNRVREEFPLIFRLANIFSPSRL